MSEFKDAILVVAHPDDECLFFSSIIDEVSKIIFCFSKIPDEKDISIGRKEALKKFPLKNINIINLNVTQAKTKLPPLNWSNLRDSNFGVKGGLEESSYNNNFHIIRNKLNNLIPSKSTVVTHNPWGEYGNSEHIQIFKIVFNIAREKKINMFVSGYFSDLTKNYLKRKQHFLIPNHNFLLTNNNFYLQLKNHYIKYGCWTWFNSYKIPSYECIYNIDLSIDLNSNFKHNRAINLPLNYLDLRSARNQYVRDFIRKLIPSFMRKLFRLIKKLF